MKTASKRIYLITLLMLSTLVAYADNKSPPSHSNVEGNYQCQRTDSANKVVNFDLSVTKTGQTYVFEWADKTGNPTIYGTGVMHPNLTNMVASSFWDAAKPENVGIEMIEIKPDGSLQSDWVLQSQNELGSSRCTKSK